MIRRGSKFSILNRTNLEYAVGRSLISSYCMMLVTRNNLTMTAKKLKIEILNSGTELIENY